MCQLSPVAFHGDTIFCLEYEGQPFTPMRPIVENLGLDWGSQSAKINTNKKRWTVAIIATVAQDGLEREMLCLPLRKLPAWFASIHPNKVRPELRAKIELYQNECDDALWNYWMNGRAERKAPTGAITARKDKYEAYIEEVEEFRARTVSEMHRLLDEGLNLVDVRKFGPDGIVGFTPTIANWLKIVATEPIPLVSSWHSMERAIRYSPLCLMKRMEEHLSGLRK